MCDFSANGTSLCLGEGEMKNSWEIVASSPFAPPLAASPLTHVFSHGLLCSLSRLASLAITGELTHRLIRIRHCVLGIELIQCTGFYSIFLRAQHTWTKVITQANNLTVHVYTENTENIWEKFTIAQLSELASWYACWPTYKKINMRMIFL